MTPEEAIERLKPYIDNEAYTEHFQDVCRIAITALEKQSPMKPNDEITTIPVLDENGAYVDADTYVYLLCPICGNQVGIDDCIDNYCSYCGQKMDRSV